MDKIENRNVRRITMSHKNNSLALETLLIVSSVFTLLCSCMPDTRSLTFAPISADGWARTDTLICTIPPLEDAKESGVSLLLQTEGYAYANISLGITIWQDSSLLYNEQQDFLLSENNPKPGVGRRCDYTLPIENFVLCDTLPTIVALTQQFDLPVLTGIRRVGVRVGSPIRKSGEPIWRVAW